MPRSRCFCVQTALRIALLFLALLLAVRSGRLEAQPADFATARQRLVELSLGGDYKGALAMARHALALAARDHGPRSAEAASAHLAIAIQHQSLGQLPEAEAHFREGMALQKRLVSADDTSLAEFTSGLGALLHGQGRYEEAEPLMREGLRLHEIDSRRTGNETGLAVALFMLGSTYTAMSRLDEGLRLFERSLAAFQRLAPQGSMQTGIVLNNIATNRQLAEDYKAALDNQLGALAMFERHSPGNLPGLAKINNNLGFLFQKAGAPDKAAEHYREAIDQLTRAFPGGHPDLATARMNHGSLLLELGRPAEAESLLVAALAESRRFLPPEHPDIAVAHGELANLRIRADDWERAAGELDAAARIHLAQAARQDVGRGSDTRSDVRRNAFTFTKLVKVEHRRLAADADRAFVMAQHALGSSAAASLAQMAVRNAKGDARLSALVRARQDLVAEWHTLDRDLVATLSNPTAAPETGEQLRSQLATIDQRIAAIDRNIAERFPDYTALANPKPLTLGEVQRELGGDEALVLVVDTPAHLVMGEETFVWVVTSNASRWVRSTLGSEALKREVAALRCGLDEAAWTGSACLDLTGQFRTDADRRKGKPLPFDTGRAHRLYAALLGDVGDLIDGKHLLVVPSGAITQLPLQVLVTRPVATPVA
ncbi:MAG: tetratricopeptide repeat protein, partial [Pseudomonadota bacterium]